MTVFVQSGRILPPLYIPVPPVSPDYILVSTGGFLAGPCSALLLFLLDFSGLLLWQHDHSMFWPDFFGPRRNALNSVLFVLLLLSRGGDLLLVSLRAPRFAEGRCSQLALAAYLTFEENLPKVRTCGEAGSFRR